MIAISDAEQRLREETTHLLRRGKTKKAWARFKRAEADHVITTALTYRCGSTLAREERDRSGVRRCRANARYAHGFTPDIEASITAEEAQLHIKLGNLARAREIMADIKSYRTPGTIQELEDQLVRAKIDLYAGSFGAAFVTLHQTLQTLLSHQEFNWTSIQLVHDLNWWLTIVCSLSNNSLTGTYAASVVYGQELLGKHRHDDKLLKRRVPALLLVLAGPFRSRLARWMLKFS